MLIHGRIKKFEEHGTVLDLNRASIDRGSHIGRPRECTQEIIAEFLDEVEMSPNRLLRERSQAMDIPFSTLRMIIRDDLNKFPYRIQTGQKLSFVPKLHLQALWDTPDQIEDLFRVGAP